MAQGSAALVVVPATVEHVEALIAGDAVFEDRFDLTVVPGYLDFPGVLEPTRRGLLEGADPEWGSHLFIDLAANELVGLGGYKGPPVEGGVEIGYSVAPSRCRRGYATSAARELIERARAAGVTLVRAHTLPEPNPSTRVLERCGLRHVGNVIDREDGFVWQWELALT
ncbi:MAG: GNAT family N-acetyltransferase [Actinobacteria bacterium]|nr:GNAT family N-acetyltransferase [Actinomycetota bacterium]